MNASSWFLRVGICLTFSIAVQTTGEYPPWRALLEAIDVLADFKERYA
jgi:hypothetical protein